VALVLHLVDELLTVRHTTGQAAPPRVCACGHTRYELKDRLPRQLHTSAGTVDFAGGGWRAGTVAGRGVRCASFWAWNGGKAKHGTRTHRGGVGE